MGTKRQHDEVESHGAASEKRHKSYIGRKRQAQEDSGAKKRIRAIERSLRRNQDMPANVRIDLERELASQKQIMEDKAYKKKRSTMISKYHMVRFFERKKASRLVKQLKRQLEQESDADKAEKIRHDLHIAEVDEAYTLYFPHLETYVGLYSSTAKKTSDEEETEESKLAAAKAALEAERPPMWAVIEKALAEGPPALEQLRDRRSPDDTGKIDDTQPPIRPRPTAPSSAPERRHNGASQHTRGQQQQRPGKGPDTSSKHDNKDISQALNRRERRRLMREAQEATNDEDDENGDGGFFEGL
ncbi:rRNA-processing protein efg1 domain-containing protein [Trichoderma breve]|uniref:rRNA-processing protein EFG1 n=1 Tax=Trichoderma breve TaxID=2034170 RepID=A0A9W9B944_9HYPO|nr:rRNA-processing protein efg1 domain-containing protein [Trichoderma breve]KAJ4858908.1 rRNA-processing protein efg1 domain-containing protein [Trichoderma breve]